MNSSFTHGVLTCRGRLAADKRRGFVDEFVVHEGFDHEQSEVHTAGDVALEDGIAHVLAPNRQSLALPLLEVVR